MLQKDVVIQGRYRIMGPLGAGAQGTVYLVESVHQPDRRLALKEMAPGELDLYQLKRFEAEAAVLVGLRHRNLPIIHDFFQEGGRLYLLMDFIPGRTLWDVLGSQPGPPPWPTAMGWLRQIAETLQFLHQRPQPITFRELEPANCILQPDGVIKLISFGLGRLFSAPDPNPFSAPEEQGDGSEDHRSDIYSFGASVYVLASRFLPPEGWERLLDPAPVAPAPGMDPAVLGLINRMMAVNPDERFATLAEAWQALQIATAPRSAAPLSAPGSPATAAQSSQAAARPAPQLKWRPAAAVRPSAPLAVPVPEDEEPDEDEATSLQKYLAEALADYEKYVMNIGQNHLAAPMLLYYRDEVQDTLMGMDALHLDTREVWAKVHSLDLRMRAQARMVVNEIGWENFKQYWIMNDPPKDRWWWYLSRQVPPPLPDKKPWEFWK